MAQGPYNSPFDSGQPKTVVDLRLESTGVTGQAVMSPVVTLTNPNSGTNSQVAYFTARVVAYAEPPGAPPAADDVACWVIEGVVQRDQSTDTVSFPTAPVVTPLYNPNAGDWAVAAAVNNPTKAFRITVSVNNFGAGPGTAPPASFYAHLTVVPAGTPL